MNANKMLILAAAATFAVLGCGGGKKVNRDTSTQSQDLSGNWNDVDADLVAKEMIGNCLKANGGWAQKFKDAHGGKNPTVKLYRVKNKSSEQINDEYFTKQFETALVNSGSVDVVAAANEGGDLDAELADQKKNASDESAKSRGNAEGADFILNGAINVQNDSAEGKEIRAYVTTMQLTDVSSRKKVWQDQKKIRKEVNQPSASF